MKKLFLIFAILGMFLNQGALANIDKDSKDDNKIALWFKENLKDGGNFIVEGYNNVMNLVHKTTGALKNSAYKKMHDFMNSGIIYTLIALIVCFWLIKLMKNGGEISKEEIYKAIMFVVVFTIIYVILNSKTAFNEVMNMFKLPSYLMQSIFEGQDSLNNSLEKVFGEPFMKTFEVYMSIYADFTNRVDLWTAQYIVGIPFSTALIGLYLLYILVALAVMLGVVVIQSYSIFLEGIYTAFAPIVIFLLLIPQTKSIFFAWLKSYIGITMYVPLSGIAIQILAANPSKLATGTEAIYSLFIFSITGLLLAVLAITVLSKIPTWISELLNVSNQGVGMGGAIGMAKMAGHGLGQAGMQAFAAQKGAANMAGKGLGAVGKGLGNFGSNLMSQTQTGQKLSSMASNASSAVKNSAAAQKMAQMKDGFTAKAQWFTTKMPPKE